MSLMLFPTEDWVTFTWSRSLPFMIPSTLIREQQTHRRLAKSHPLYQSSSDESWTLITVSSDKSKSSASVPGCWQSIDWEGQNKRSRSSLICWGWGVYKLGWTQQAIEWNSGELYSVLLILTYRPKPDFTMKISGTSLDLSATDYGITLDPTFTMLEFDGLRVLPLQTGTSNLWFTDSLPSYWQ